METLARTELGLDGRRAAYRVAQRDARTVLSRHRPRGYSDEPPDHVTTWWCAECGGIDAPQPCLGICVWGPADWVNRTVYEAERSRAAADRDAERALVHVLRRVASVTPRVDQWERNWLVLHSEAREALRDCAGDRRLRPSVGVRLASPRRRHPRLPGRNRSVCVRGCAAGAPGAIFLAPARLHLGSRRPPARSTYLAT